MASYDSGGRQRVVVSDSSVNSGRGTTLIANGHVGVTSFKALVGDDNGVRESSGLGD